MATLLEGGLIGFLMPVFIFLFIFVIFFAVMSKFKFFGEKQGIHALIAFCLAILFVLVPETREIVNFVTPWFILLVLFGMLIIIGLLFMGYREADLVTSVTEGGTILSIAIVAVVILFFVALTHVFGPSAMEPGGEGFTGAIKSVLFNPRVLGVAFILLVAAEVVRKVGFKD